LQAKPPLYEGGEMPITYQLDIVAPIGMVFEQIDDDEKLKLWMEGLEETIYPQGRDPHNPLGTCFIQKIREGGRVGEYTGEVIAYEKPTRLAIDIGNSQFTMRVDYRLSPTPVGTRLDYSVETIKATWLVRLLGKIFSGFTRRLLDRQMKKLKELAESQPLSRAMGQR
jgi:uncharacterized protein YndB with AHSA1/START domain